MSIDSKLRDSGSDREVKKLSRWTLPALDLTRRNRVMVGAGRSLALVVISRPHECASLQVARVSVGIMIPSRLTSMTLHESQLSSSLNDRFRRL